MSHTETNRIAMRRRLETIIKRAQDAMNLYNEQGDLESLSFKLEMIGDDARSGQKLVDALLFGTDGNFNDSKENLAKKWCLE